jgi:hypothetical protein
MIMLRGREGAAVLFRCGAAARWLPRTLGSVVLAAATMAAFRMDPHGFLLSSTYIRNGVVLAGALAALFIVRLGAEVRTTVEVGETGLLFSHGARSHPLSYDNISRLGYAAPFAATRNWLPAMLLFDKDRGCWRLLSMIRDGDRLLRMMLERSGRADLVAWAESLTLERRMAGSARRVIIGYIISAAVLAAGLLYYFHE